MRKKRGNWSLPHSHVGPLSHSGEGEKVRRAGVRDRKKKIMENGGEIPGDGKLYFPGSKSHYSSRRPSMPAFNLPPMEEEDDEH